VNNQDTYYYTDYFHSETTVNSNIQHVEVTSQTDYSPGGMLLPNRHESSSEYRYGFNGQEKDDEISGEGNSYTAEHWQYDSRLIRRWNRDPVVKVHESPYAAFANNPIWFGDVDGADTLVMHRSEPIKEFTNFDKETIIYKVTYSVIRDGVEFYIDKSMYMMASTYSASQGDNGLPDEYYNLEWDQMSHHDGQKNWENTIRVTDFGVFIHPGNSNVDFWGCAGLTCSDPIMANNKLGFDAIVLIENTVDALIEVRNLYNEVDGDGTLTGNKFILQTNSTAEDEFATITKIKPREIRPIKVNFEIPKMEPRAAPQTDGSKKNKRASSEPRS